MKKLVKYTTFVLLLLLLYDPMALGQWMPLNTQSEDHFNDVFFVNVDTGFLISYEGNIILTEDGGNTWGHINSCGYSLCDIDFSSADTGYVVGNNGALLKTINGGANWYFGSSGTDVHLRGICFVDKLTGFYCGQAQTIAKTTDGGVTWDINSYGIWWLREFYFINADTGYCVGDGGRIMKTTNCGASWTLLYSGTEQNLVDVMFLDADTGYVCGNNGTILKTTDGGESWILQESGTYNNIKGLFFLNPSLGYASGLYATLLKTTDGGANWVLQGLSVNNSLTRIDFPDENTGYIAGHGGLALKTCSPAIADFTYIIEELTVIFTPVNTGNYDYWWDFGDGYNSSLESPSYAYPDTGIYQACLTLTDSCGPATSCEEIEVFINGVDEYPGEACLYIYPNPVSDILYLKNHLQLFINEIRIFDLQGSLAHSKTVRNKDLSIQTQLNLVEGYYLLEVIHNSGKIHRKLVVKH